jgi:5-methylcytosine-specific restriction endonuclease McrA
LAGKRWASNGRKCVGCAEDAKARYLARGGRERENERRRLPPEEKACRKAERAARRDARRATAVAAKVAAREAKAAQRAAEWEASRPEMARRERERRKADRKVNKARRRAAKKGATVELSPEEKKKVSALYTEARRLTKETGYQWSVHHVIPLSKGGPHHPDNLEVISEAMNNAIGDKPMKGWDYLMS